MSNDRPMSLAELEAQITADLIVIRDLWDRMLPTIKAIPLGHMGGGTSRTSTAKDADNGDHNTDVDNLDIVMSDRGDITAVLQGWARVVVEDFDVTTVIPHGHDVRGMCVFLMRWARHMTGHEAAQDMADELHTAAVRVLRYAKPRGRREWIWIGDCPNVIGCEGDPVVCATPIRVYPQRAIKCAGCGVEDTLDGWIVRIVGSHQLVTAEQLTPILHKKLGIVASRDKIRQWVHRGVITPAKDDDGRVVTDSQGRTLYDRFTVFAQLTHRPGA